MIEMLSRFKDLGETDNCVPSLCRAWSGKKTLLSHLGSEQKCPHGLLRHEARRQACRVLQAKHGVMAATWFPAPGRGIEMTFP